VADSDIEVANHKEYQNFPRQVSGQMSEPVAPLLAQIGTSSFGGQSMRSQYMLDLDGRLGEGIVEDRNGEPEGEDLAEDFEGSAAWCRFITDASYTGVLPGGGALPGTLPVDGVPYPTTEEEPMSVHTGHFPMGTQGAASPLLNQLVSMDPMADFATAAMASQGAHAGTPVVPSLGWETTLTVMMRNLPNKYSQQMLLEEINSSGFQGTYDFLYLPIDTETNANKGYAFINFIDPGFAWMFKTSFEGRKMNRFNSTKHVSVVPATLQGFEANHAHYSKARVSRGDPSARPLFLREPERSPYQERPVAGMPDPGGMLGRRRRRGGGDKGGGGGGGGGCPGGSQMNRAAMPFPVPGQCPQQASQPQDAADAGRLGGLGMPESGMQVKFCAFCGGRVQAHFRFCQFCGACCST